MPAFYQLDFEKPLRDLEQRIERAVAPATEFHALGGVTLEGGGSEESAESLRAEHARLLTDLYSRLSPWDTVRVVRDTNRPQTRS